MTAARNSSATGWWRRTGGECLERLNHKPKTGERMLPKPTKSIHVSEQAHQLGKIHCAKSKTTMLEWVSKLMISAVQSDQADKECQQDR